jgi:hypothetical protein
VLITAGNELPLEGPLSQVASAVSNTSPRIHRIGVRSTDRAAIALAGLASALMLTLPAAALSAPRVLEEVARVPLPDVSYNHGSRVAVYGDDLIVTGRKVRPRPDDPFRLELVQAAFLFKRQANGSWTFVTQLGPERRDDVDNTDWSDIAAAIDGDVLAIQPRELRVYERTPMGWVSAPTDGPLIYDGTDVEVSNGTIFVSGNGCGWGGGVVIRNSAGVWTQSELVLGGSASTCSDDSASGDIDISGDALIVANEHVRLADNPEGPAAVIFERSGNAWIEAARLANFGGTESDRVGPVAIDATTAYVGGSTVTGLRVFDRNAAGEWQHTTTMAPSDAFAIGDDGRVEAEGYAVVAYSSDPYRRGSVGVFQRQSSGEFEEIARLVRSDAVANSPTIHDVDIDVNAQRTRIVLGAAGAAYVYELGDTTQPEVVQDNFQDGNANGWSPSNISSWTVRTSGRSRVYRQTSFASESRSVLTSLVWTNQAAEVDVIPTAIQGTDRFAGLAVRMGDAQNYYYAALRSSNTLQLRKKVNGTFVTLASAPFQFQLNRRYRLRVEAIGTLIRAHVNGALVLEAIDRSHAQGSPGLLTWGARGDFDNVVVTPNPLRSLFADDFTTDTSRWTTEFGTWVDAADFAQTSTVGKGRAIAGISTNDMIVQARARATSALVSGGWFGVMARHIDDRNFYYLRLGDGRVSIRRYLNGAFVELAGVPFTVSSNVTYTLRLEVVGTTLRGYVNNQFYVEANDASHAAGRYGLASNLTAVRFDDVRVQQP